MCRDAIFTRVCVCVCLCEILWAEVSGGGAKLFGGKLRRAKLFSSILQIIVEYPHYCCK